MANKYFTLVTKLGQAKLANASVTGEKLAFSKIALGSGEGTPNESQTALQAEKWRGPVSNVAIDESNPNWVVIEAVIPHNAGGFTIAEIGVFDEAGDLVVVGNYPKTYKPVVEEGTTKDVAIRIIIEVSNAENVTIKVDPSVVIATRKYVDDAIKNAIGGIDLSELASKAELSEHETAIADKNKLGHVKVGGGLSIDHDGVLSVTAYPTIYGFEIDETNADPYGAVKYIGDSSDFTPLKSGDGTVTYGSWADKFPINRLKVVLLKDGVVAEELNKNDYRKTKDGRTVDITSGELGDVMVAIPLTYWKFNRVGTKLRVYVSDGQPDTDFKAYAHSRNGVVQDEYLYVGAFKGTVASGKLRSLHDTMSSAEITIGKFREHAEANGDGYGQMNWATMTLLQIYSVLLTKSLDSQSSLGMGYTNNYSSHIKNGATVAYGLFYGEQTGKKQMKFLGLEDFYGNRFEWVDGFATSSSRDILINDKNVNYNDAGDGYTKHGKCFDEDGYIKGVEGTTGTGFIPKVASGASTSTYYCDYAYQSSSGGRVADFGGNRSSSDGGARAGAFCFSASYAPSYSGAIRGARCLFLKSK